MVFYKLLKLLTNIFYRIFYRLEYSGIEKIPKGKPIILAPNHVNAFIDPVIIATLLNRNVRFFARGDVFNSRFAKWMFNQLNISPIYRIQEGYSELKKNDKTFEECRKLLSENKIVLLFPEAICVQERRIRPLKKGLARIAFQTEDTFDFNKDILIIPVGLNYSAPFKFRSRLFIDFGNPVSLKNYSQQYKEDKVKTINEFTKIFEQKMSQHLVIINNYENDKLVEGIEEIYKHQWMRDRKADVNKMENQYLASKQIASMINWLEKNDNDLLISLKENVLSYINKLNEVKLRDHLLRPETINKMNAGTFILEFIIIYLGFPIYGIGLIMNYPPYYIAKKLSDKKVKKVEFFASFYANIAMFLWLFYFLFQIVFVALYFRNWLGLGVYAAVVIITGLYVLKFYSIKQKILGRWRLLRMVRKQKSVVEEILNNRMEIISELDSISQSYPDSFIKNNS